MNAAMERPTALLVEDEAALRPFIRAVLRLSGLTVLEANDGPEALALCAQHKGPITLLVTDLVMPKMTGSELAKALLPTCPEMKVLYISGFSKEAAVHGGFLKLGDNFLQKPCTIEKITDSIKRLLPRH